MPAVKDCGRTEVMNIIATYALQRSVDEILDNETLYLVHGRCNSLKIAYVSDD